MDSRFIKLKQKWETHEVGEEVCVGKDTYKLLLDNDMGEKLDFDTEVKLLTAVAEDEQKALAEEEAGANLDEDKIALAVKEQLDRTRTGAPLVGEEDEFGVEGEGIGKSHAPSLKALGWRSSAEFLFCAGRAIASKGDNVDPRLSMAHIVKTTGYHEEGDESLGGYVVPEDVRTELLKDALEANIVRSSGARVIPTNRDSVTLSRIVDNTHASRVFGNVLVYWLNEGETLTASNITIGQIKIPVHKLGALCYATSELLADAAVAFEAEITQNFGEGVAYFEDLACLTGSGAGQPKGILTSGAAVAVTRAGASAISFADAVNMYVRQRYPARAVWVANQTALAQLLQMKDSGNSVIWINTGQGATSTPPGTLWGRPIKFTEKLPAMGTAKDLSFIDFSRFIIVDRESLRVDRSDHVLFTSDQVAFRFIRRVGGLLRDDAVFTPRNGDTLSPVVYLS